MTSRRIAWWAVRLILAYFGAYQLGLIYSIATAPRNATGGRDGARWTGGATAVTVLVFVVVVAVLILVERRRQRD